MSGRRTNNRYGSVNASVNGCVTSLFWASLSEASAWAIQVVNSGAAREVILWREWAQGAQGLETLGVYRAKAS